MACPPNVRSAGTSWEPTEPEAGLQLLWATGPGEYKCKCPTYWGHQFAATCTCTCMAMASHRPTSGAALVFSAGQHHPHFPFMYSPENVNMTKFLGTFSFTNRNTCHIGVYVHVFSLLELLLSNREKRNQVVRKFSAWARVYPSQFQ